jgi:photosystem II stability/assembly factor-like uncharacterized protein
VGGKPGVLYLGTHYGLFTSNDNGRTWPQTRDMLNTLMITTISVSPKDPSALAVVGSPSTRATGDAGIYFSSDNGTTWNLRQPAHLPPTAYPFTVRAGSASASHFYAFYLYAGWYETNDMGLHWQAITHSPLSDMLNPTLLTFPDDPRHLVLGGDRGLFETRDNGEHWTQITTVQGNVTSLTASTNKPTTIFCTTDQGIYTWQNSSTATPHIVPLHFPGNTMPARLTVDPAGSTLYGLAGRDLWYSNDSGATWTQRKHFDRGDMVALLIDPHHSERLYAAFFQPSQALFSTDHGTSWHTLAS